MTPAIAFQAPPTATPVVAIEDGVQVLRTFQVANGYLPADAALYAGLPTRWIIESLAGGSCAIFLQSPALGLAVTLEEGDNPIDLPPLEPGRIAYSCSMGMYGGTLTVVDARRTASWRDWRPADPSARHRLRCRGCDSRAVVALRGTGAEDSPRQEQHRARRRSTPRPSARRSPRPGAARARPPRPIRAPAAVPAAGAPGSIRPRRSRPPGTRRTRRPATRRRGSRPAERAPTTVNMRAIDTSRVRTSPPMPTSRTCPGSWTMSASADRTCRAAIAASTRPATTVTSPMPMKNSRNAGASTAAAPTNWVYRASRRRRSRRMPWSRRRRGRRCRRHRAAGPDGHGARDGDHRLDGRALEVGAAVDGHQGVDLAQDRCLAAGDDDRRGIFVGRDRDVAGERRRRRRRAPACPRRRRAERGTGR